MNCNKDVSASSITSSSNNGGMYLIRIAGEAENIALYLRASEI
jgi:hypothetical protein